MVQSKFKRYHQSTLLVITVDDKLNFNLHIDKVCLKFANQLNELVRLKHFLGNEEGSSLNK